MDRTREKQQRERIKTEGEGRMDRQTEGERTFRKRGRQRGRGGWTDRQKEGERTFRQRGRQREGRRGR